MDYQNIVLLRKEQKILKKLSRTKTINLGGYEPFELLKNNFVEKYSEKRHPNGFLIFEGKYQITEDGIRYLKHQSIKRQEKISAELRGWVTTVIAVAAFVLSIISLLLRSGK